MGDGRPSLVSEYDEIEAEVRGMNLIRRKQEARTRIESEASEQKSLGPEPTSEELDIIKGWSDVDYLDIRSGAEPEKAKALEDWISRQPAYEKSLYRGIESERPIKFKKGMVIDQNGLSSWTESTTVAEQYTDMIGEPHKYLFVMEGGSKHSGDIVSYSRHKYEKEHVLSGNSKQRVTKTQKSYDFTYVYVEEVE